MSTKISDKLWEKKSAVIGWDVEWQPSLTGKNIKTTADEMVQLIEDLETTMLDDRIVILTHSAMFQTSHGYRELSKFIKTLVQDGYTFHTVEDLAVTKLPSSDDLSYD